MLLNVGECWWVLVVNLIKKCYIVYNLFIVAYNEGIILFELAMP